MAAVATRRRRRSASEWAALIDRFEASGLSRVEFCKRHDLGAAAFERWSSRIRRRRAAHPTINEKSFVRLDPWVDAAPLNQEAEETGPVVSACQGAEPSAWEIELDLGDLRLSRTPWNNRLRSGRIQSRHGKGCNQCTPAVERAL